MARIKQPVLQSHPDPIAPSQSSQSSQSSQTPSSSAQSPPSRTFARQARINKTNTSNDKTDDEMEISKPKYNCPNCLIPFFSMKYFREHVEACARPSTAASTESGGSALTTPAASLPPEDNDLPGPYSADEVSIYPERKNLDEDDEGGEMIPEIKQAKITDMEKFANSLADLDDLPYDEAYRRVANSQGAMEVWQTEWMNLDAAIKTAKAKGYVSSKEIGKAKDEQKPVNPRIPKVSKEVYQDQVQSFVYGYEHRPGERYIGQQDPILQRIKADGTAGRHLRMRHPTQRAVDNEISEESGVDSTQAQVMDTEGIALDGVRPRRIKKPTSRIMSESREPTPLSFASPKRGGRLGNGNGPSRLNMNTLSFAERAQLYVNEMNASEQQPIRRWNSTIDGIATDMHSRPGTSSTAATQQSFFDTEREEESESGYTTKRKNRGSDPEFGRPSKKSKAQKTFKSAERIDLDEDEEAVTDSKTAKVKNTVRSEAGKLAWAKRKAAAAGLQEPERIKNETENAESGMDANEDNAASTQPRKYIKKGPKSKEVVDLTGDKANRKVGDTPASRNMLQRWARKREAEKAGLVPPPIGRYKKSEKAEMAAKSASEAPSMDNANENSKALPTASPSQGKKRKHEENNEEIPAAENNQIATESAVPAPNPRKKSKKNTQPSQAIDEVIDGGASQPPAKQKGKGTKTVAKEEDLGNGEDLYSLPREEAPRNIQPPGPTLKRSGRGNKAASAPKKKFRTSVSTANEEPSGSTQPPQSAPEPSEDASGNVETESIVPRTSGRVRRQTTAALSAIQQELPGLRKRTRQASATAEADPPTVQTQNEQVDELELPAKKRRGNRQPKASTNDQQTEHHHTLVASLENEHQPEAPLEPTSPATKKSKSGRCPKNAGAQPPANPQVPQSLDIGEGPSAQTGQAGTGVDREVDAEAAAKAAARAAKSAKMKAITKARWASGEMEAVMARKKANNAARKAAEAEADANGLTPGSLGKKQVKKTVKHIKKASSKVPARRQTLGSLTDGANDAEASTPILPQPSYTSGKKLSEYERFQQLTSPSGSPLPARGRRPAALRASQSFSRYDADDDEDEEEYEQQQQQREEAPPDDEDETQIKRQFASEYDHYQALASPKGPILLGKRVRKPVMNLKEAMAIEAGDIDDDFEE